MLASDCQRLTMHFLASSLIFFALQLPMILLSFLVVPISLLSKWDGTTSWFGNYKYGRGDTHYKAPSKGEYWKQARFLCIRNPVSNFGKQVLAVEPADWVWLHTPYITKRFRWQYGWKNPVNGKRTFVYRPWFR